MSCHVMSCHVMSCRHCCINSKKSFSKTFSFHKIIYKYFAGFLACYLDCHASLHQRWADACSARNDGKNIVIASESVAIQITSKEACKISINNFVK